MVRPDRHLFQELLYVGSDDTVGLELRGHHVAERNQFASGEVPVPILSVVSSGTRHPLRKRLSRLNHAIIKTSLRVIASPYLFMSSLSVSSCSVPLFDNSSVALHTRTYSGLMPTTGPSLPTASISLADRPVFLAIRVLACHS